MNHDFARARECWFCNGPLVTWTIITDEGHHMCDDCLASWAYWDLILKVMP